MKAIDAAVFGALAIALCGGCQTVADRAAKKRGMHYEQLRELAASTKVDPSDGISEVEAFRIGLNRFRTYRTACGMPSLPKEAAGYWHITIYFGLAGLPVEQVTIRKSDGVITVTDLRLR
ncbi:MAG TPA: hypothetical protein VMM36_19455 [Opitutaceae bacterium]|nr:hypothetical protein [Opitutaceae bacterium]